MRYRFPQSFAIHRQNKNSDQKEWKRSPTLPDCDCRQQIDPGPSKAVHAQLHSPNFAEKAEDEKAGDTDGRADEIDQGNSKTVEIPRSS
jgi:hypothetical protein